MEEHGWNNAEKSFAFEWREASKVLDSLFNNHYLDLQVNITSRERLVCATIIQWLGSNTGNSFLIKVLDKEGFKIVKKDE